MFENQSLIVSPLPAAEPVPRPADVPAVNGHANGQVNGSTNGHAPSSVPAVSVSASPPRTIPIVRARYDAAAVTEENARHWSAADGLSARAANSPEVRKKLRDRARYEVANNSYASGIIDTLANDVIGTGPRLQMLTGAYEVDRRIEIEFERWAAVVGLAEKLRTMKKSKATDGEAFGILTTNPLVDHPVQLDIRLVEADQVADPFAFVPDPDVVDGIKFDRFGNPVEYTILEDHPGDRLQYGFNKADRFPAGLVMHWFRVDRPGQARGIPEITPAINLFGQLRRYTLAVLAAAETAADFAAVLYTDLPPDSEEQEAEASAFERLEIDRRMMTTLPAGWKMGQFKAEQPTTSYRDFKAEILCEIARCLNMPFNIAAGNSSGYNYSSGRLDHQTYYKSIGIEQYHLESVVLNRIFFAWLREAYLTTNLLPDPPDRLAGWPHQWFWDGTEHVDPNKEAYAQETKLRNFLTTLSQEYARQGLDWEEQVRQIARERDLLEELNLPLPGAPATPQKVNPNNPMGSTSRSREGDDGEE